MKNLFLAFLLVCNLSSQSQNTTTKTDTLTKSNLSSIKNLREFLPELPSQFKSIEASLVVRVNENTYEVEWKGLDLSSEALTLLKSVQAGTKIFLDVKLEETNFRVITRAWKVSGYE